METETKKGYAYPGLRYGKDDSLIENFEILSKDMKIMEIIRNALKMYLNDPNVQSEIAKIRQREQTTAEAVLNGAPKEQEEVKTQEAENP